MKEINDCNKYWWRHLFYINNLYNDGQVCFGHSWYLAVDTQMFVIGVIVFVFFKSKRAKVGILTILCILALLIPPLMIYYKDLDSLFVLSPKNFNNKLMLDPNFINMHTSTECNAFTYLQGLILGLIVYNLQAKNFSLKKYKKYGVIIWVVILVGYGIVASFGIFYLERPRFPVYFRVLYGALAKPIYGLVTVIGLFLYIFNINATIRAVFDREGWTVPSRLSYCAYIVHLTIMKTLLANIEMLTHTSITYMMETILFCMVTSFVVAFPLWMLVEAPFVQLGKHFMTINEVSNNETDVQKDIQNKAKETCEEERL